MEERFQAFFDLHLRVQEAGLSKVTEAQKKMRAELGQSDRAFNSTGTAARKAADVQSAAARKMMDAQKMAASEAVRADERVRRAQMETTMKHDEAARKFIETERQKGATFATITEEMIRGNARLRRSAEETSLAIEHAARREERAWRGASSASRTHSMGGHAHPSTLEGLGRRGISAGKVAGFGIPAMVGLAGVDVLARGAEFGAQSMEQGAQLNESALRLSQQANLRPNDALSLSVLANSRGIQARTLGMAFGTAGGQLNKALQGSRSAQENFAQLGIGEGQLRGLQNNLPALLDLIHQQAMRLPSSQAASLQRTMMGRGASQLGTVFAEGGFTPVMASVRQATGGMSPEKMREMAKASAEMKDAMAGIQLAILRAFGPAAAAMLKAITPAMKPLGDAFASIGKAFAPVAPIIGKAIATMATEFAKMIQRKDVQQMMKDLAKSMVDLVAAVIPLIPLFAKMLTPLFLQSMGAFVEVMKIAVPVQKDLTAGVEAMSRFIPRAWKKIQDAVGGAVDAIKGALKDVADWLGGAFTDAWNALTKTVPKAIGDAFDSAVTFLKGVPDKFQKLGSDIIDAIVKGLKDAGPKISNTLWDVVPGPAKTILKQAGIDFSQHVKAVTPVRKRGGGYIDELSPALVSPGEMIVHQGAAMMVPGQRTAQDNVPMMLPAGAAVITGHGQELLSRGHSLDDTLSMQAPHFREGGVVPHFRGGGLSAIPVIGPTSKHPQHTSPKMLVYVDGEMKWFPWTQHTATIKGHVYHLHNGMEINTHHPDHHHVRRHHSGGGGHPSSSGSSGGGGGGGTPGTSGGRSGSGHGFGSYLQQVVTLPPAGGRRVDIMTVGSLGGGNGGASKYAGQRYALGAKMADPTFHHDGPWWAEGDRHAGIGKAFGGKRGGQAARITYRNKSTVAFNVDIGNGNSYGDIYPASAHAIGFDRTGRGGPLHVQFISDAEARQLVSGATGRGGAAGGTPGTAASVQYKVKTGPEAITAAWALGKDKYRDPTSLIERQEIAGTAGTPGTSPASVPGAAHASSGGYVFPLPSFARQGRTDRGVDMEASHGYAATVALGAGIITSNATGFSTKLRLTEGSHKGQIVFYGHNSKSRTRIGQHVRAGQVVGATGGAPFAGATHTEIGFESSDGAFSGHYPSGRRGTRGAIEMVRLLHQMDPGKIKLKYTSRRGRKGARAHGHHRRAVGKHPRHSGGDGEPLTGQDWQTGPLYTPQGKEVPGTGLSRPRAATGPSHLQRLLSAVASDDSQLDALSLYFNSLPWARLDQMRGTVYTAYSRATGKAKSNLGQALTLLGDMTATAMSSAMTSATGDTAKHAASWEHADANLMTRRGIDSSSVEGLQMSLATQERELREMTGHTFTPGGTIDPLTGRLHHDDAPSVMQMDGGHLSWKDTSTSAFGQLRAIQRRAGYGFIHGPEVDDLHKAARGAKTHSYWINGKLTPMTAAQVEAYRAAHQGHRPPTSAPRARAHRGHMYWINGGLRALTPAQVLAYRRAHQGHSPPSSAPKPRKGRGHGRGRGHKGPVQGFSHTKRRGGIIGFSAGGVVPGFRRGTAGFGGRHSSARTHHQQGTRHAPKHGHGHTRSPGAAGGHGGHASGYHAFDEMGVIPTPPAIMGEISDAMTAMAEAVDDKMTQIIATRRALAEAIAQEAVTTTVNTTGLDQAALQHQDLQQQLADAFRADEPTAAEKLDRAKKRGEYVNTKIVGDLNKEVGAMENQRRVAKEQGDVKLAEQIAKAIADKQNEILQAQLDAQLAIKEATKATETNTDNLKNQGGTLGFQFQSQDYTDLIGVGTGA